MIQEDAKVKAAANLATRMERKKKIEVLKALEIAKDIDVPIDVLMKKSTAEAAHKVVELLRGIQDLVVASELLNIAEGAQRENVPYS